MLREPAAIAKRFAELEASVEREILVFTKPPYAVEPAENLEGLELPVNARSRRAACTSARCYDDEAHAAAILAPFVAAGEQARVVDELPIKLVADRRASRDVHDGGPLSRASSRR